MNRIVISGLVLILVAVVNCYPQFDNGNRFEAPWQNPWTRPQQSGQPPTSPVGSGSPTTTTARPTTQSPRYYACLQSCPATSEYNPICGSDNVIYYNENKFNCALTCGLSIRQLYRGVCQT
ncbi:uncharacterized protein LOC108099148 [Drosophila ficusphila]|uniref:uncharacterized protein LOC108099148 n=1 Tax=Drosophila ficusphila TaxID=30025 RepID=UPI0007E6075B|nr:uncharacterized protein LOC108099148 [Drosophila ficusphila]